MAAAAAVLAGFNAALTRIGFSAEVIASVNQNQVTSTMSLIGMSKEDVKQLMKIVRGGHGVPIIPVPFSYVICEDAIPGDLAAAYPSEHARLIATTPHAGLEFETDNGQVFDHLKSWTLNGPAWTWIRSFNTSRNGRAAWQALLDHYEGDAQKDRVKDAAYASIAQACYFGDRKRFSFETYITIH